MNIWLRDRKSPSSWLQSPARRLRVSSLLRSSTALFPRTHSAKILRRTLIWRNRPVLLTRIRNLVKPRTFFYHLFCRLRAPVLRLRSRALILVTRLGSCFQASKSLSRSHLWNHFHSIKAEHSRTAFIHLLVFPNVWAPLKILTREQNWMKVLNWPKIRSACSVETVRKGNDN